MWTAIITALIISSFNLLASVIVARYAYEKEFSRFSNIVLSSLVVRYMIVATSVWLGLAYFKEFATPFGLVFMISTFIFIFLEIFFFQYYSKLFNLQKR
jgi:low affinity Fe/Cu permease